MKKILFFILMLFPLSVMAQFNAYQYGQDVVKRIQQQQEAQIRNNPTLMNGHMISAIAAGNDEKAFEYADYLAQNYGRGVDWYWLGVLYEAGIQFNNLDMAKWSYGKGASKADGNGCQNRLNEIAAGRRLDANTVRQYCRQIVAASQAAVPIYDPYAGGLSSGGSSSGSSSGSRTSSGPCSRCHGTRIDPVMIDYSPGSSTMSDKIPANTRCPYCGEIKSIDHWHKRCIDCAHH